jgi:K(+)-stimulated pyrophosphate-energized sodium pump
MALLAAYMEEIRIWIGRMANSSGLGFKQIGDFVFYTKTAPK